MQVGGFHRHSTDTSITQPKSGAWYVYLASYGSAGTSCTAHHHRLIGPFGYVTLLPDTQQCSEACYTNNTQKVGQMPVNQLRVNLRQIKGKSSQDAFTHCTCFLQGIFVQAM